MADTENDRVKQLELQLQETLQWINELTALTTGQQSSSTNEDQSDLMEAGLQPTDDQFCSGTVTSVASRAVGVRGEGAEGHALQSGSSSQVSSRPEPLHGEFLLQQTFDHPPFSLDGYTTLKRYFERFEEYC